MNTVNGNTLLAAYFRKEFTVTNPNASPTYVLKLLFDDPAIVYLNGNEIGRVNMSGSNPGYSTLGNGSSGDNAMITFDLDASVLNAGTNTFAVEVHQDDVNSTDLSFDLSLTLGPPIIRGPYLQKLTPNSVVVKWRTNRNMESKVMYGLTVGATTDSIVSSQLNTEHELEITGLLPNQKYYYFIKDGDDISLPASADQYFITSPPHGTVQPVTAWILGDPGTANADARSVRDAYYNYIGSNH